MNSPRGSTACSNDALYEVGSGAASYGSALSLTLPSFSSSGSLSPSSSAVPQTTASHPAATTLPKLVRGACDSLLAFAAQAAAEAATQASGALVTQAQMLRTLRGLRDCSLPQQLQGAKQLGAGSFGGVHAIHRRLPDGSPACVKV